MMKKLSIFLYIIPAFVGLTQNTYPSNTWRTIGKDCKIGYMDPSGKVRIEPVFDHATEFQEGLAFVWSFPGYNEDRENVPLGEDYINYERFNLQGNRKTGIIDSSGKYVVEPRPNFEFFSHFQDGVAQVEIDNKIVFIDSEGKVIEHYDPVLTEKRMKEIRRVAQYGSELPRKYCFVDASNRAVLASFDEVAPFSENLAAVRLGKHFGYISRNGDMKIVPQFQRAGSFVDGFATVAITTGSDGISKLLYGVIDTTGKFIIPAIFDFLDNPSQGFVVVGKDNGEERKFGLMNMKAEEVIPVIYKEMGKYSEGLIPVKLNKKFGYIDLKQNVKIKAMYEWARPFRNGVAYARINENKTVLINTAGDILWGSYEKSNCNP